MSARAIGAGYPYFVDKNGHALDFGYVYIGTENLDPETNPINVYWDNSLTIPALQPLRTMGGFIVRAGTPTAIYSNSDYSIKIKDKKQETLYTNLSVKDNAASSLSSLANTTDPTQGDYLIGVKQTLAGGAARTQHAKNQETISVTDWGADPLGSADSTAAFNAASAAASGKTLRIPAGNYKLTSTWSIDGSASIVGDGSKVTQITFVPTADDVCLNVSNGANQVVLPVIRGLHFYSDDTTFAKVAIDLYDTSSLILDDIYVSGAKAGTPVAPYWGGGTGSIGIRTAGREASSLSNLRIVAEYPIYIQGNPNSSAQGLEDVDHWFFYNLYLSALGHYCIHVADGHGMSHAVFDGYQAWVGGTGGLRMNDNRGAGGGYLPSRNIVIRNLRTEQQTDAAGYAIYLKSALGTQQIRLENILCGYGCNGIYVGRVERLTLSNITTATAGVALLVDDMVYTGTVDMEQCLWDTSGTVTLTNMKISQLRSLPPVSAGPASATYVFDNSGSTLSNWFVVGRGATASTAPADTNENILATCTVPAGVMGKFGQIRVKTQWYTTNNANAKTARIRLGGIGGTDFLTASLASTLSTINEITIGNRSATNSQYGPPPGGLSNVSGFGVSALGPLTGSIDTTIAQTLVITAQKGTAGDDFILLTWCAEVCPG